MLAKVVGWVLALVAALFAAPALASAASTTPAITLHSWAGGTASLGIADPAQKRGPPVTTYDQKAQPSAVDASSHGSTARLRSTPTWTYTAYDHAVPHVQAAGGSRTTRPAPGSLVADVRALPGEGVAANAGSRLLSPSSLADEVVNATGGVLKTNKGGFTVEIPHGTRGITVRVMERGGTRTNYYRVSVPGKETYTVTGEASTDAALTHIGITESSLDDILSIVARIQGGG